MGGRGPKALRGEDERGTRPDPPTQTDKPRPTPRTAEGRRPPEPIPTHEASIVFNSSRDDKHVC